MSVFSKIFYSLYSKKYIILCVILLPSENLLKKDHSCNAVANDLNTITIYLICRNIEINSIEDTIDGWKYDDGITINLAQSLICTLFCFISFEFGLLITLHIPRNCA